jgi:hypothetical protein
MVLNQWVNAVSLEEVTINNIVFDFVAVINHEREINHQTSKIPIVIMAVGIVRGKPVVSPEFVFRKPIYNDAPAGTHRVGG